MILLALLLLSTEVAVTVDDLPVAGPEVEGVTRIGIAEKMLRVFRAHRLPPVYGFVNGGRPDPGVLAIWRAAGNPLGNHTYRHLDLNRMTPADYIAEIVRNQPFMTARVFRYPGLAQGDTREKRDAVRRWLADNGYTIAQVSIDFDDWAWNEPLARCTARHDWTAVGELRRSFLDAAVVGLSRARELSQEVEGREIRHVLLLHLSAIDAEMLDWVLNSYEAAGVRWIPLEQALADPIYARDAGVVWKAGATVLDEWARALNLPYPNRPTLPWPDEDQLDAMCR